MDPNSDLITGINTTDIVALNNDTQKRLSSIFDQQPTQINYPEVKFGNPSQDSNLNFDDTIKQKLANGYLNGIKGSTQLGDTMSVPQSETRRYTNDDYGFKINRDNEDFFASKQSVAEQLLKAPTNLAMLTTTKLGTGLGYVAGLLNPINWGKNYIASAADNGVSKFFSDLEDKTKNQWLPIYQKAAARNMGFFQRALGGDSTFWTSDAVDMAAFMASAFIPGLGLSKLGLGVKLATSLGMAVGDAVDTSSALMKGLQSAALKYTDKALINAVNTASESMFEAKGVKDDLYNKLISEGKTHKEATDESAVAARNTFLANVAALSFSNAWETKLFFKNLGKTAEKKVINEGIDLAETGLDKAYEAAKPTSRLGKILDSKAAYYVKKAVEGIGVEGFYEENIQLAIQRTNERRNTYGSFLEQYLGQTIDALKGDDPEASENIGGGALLGGVFGTLTSIKNKEYTNEKLETERALLHLEQAKENWRKFGNGYVKNEEGKYVFDTDKFIATNFQQADAKRQLELSEQLKNPITSSMVRKNAFASLVSAHWENGSVNALLDQLHSVQNTSPESLIKMGLDPNENIKDQIPEYVELAKKISSIKNLLDKMPVVTAKDQLKKNLLFEKAVNKEIISQEISKNDNRLLSINAQIGNSSASDFVVDQLNVLNAQKDSYSLIDKEHKSIKEIQNQYDKLEKDNSETLKGLHKDSSGYYDYENKLKNSHILMKEYAKTIGDKAQLLNALNDVDNDQKAIQTNKDGYVDKKYNEALDEIKKTHEELVKKQKEKEELDKKKAEEAKAQEKTATTAVSPTAAPIVTPYTEDVKKEPLSKKDLNDNLNIAKIANKLFDGNVLTSDEDKEIYQANKEKIQELIKKKEEQKDRTSINKESAIDIRLSIPDGDEIDEKTLASLTGRLWRAYNNKTISPEEYEQLSDLVESKKVIDSNWKKFNATPDDVSQAIETKNSETTQLNDEEEKQDKQKIKDNIDISQGIPDLQETPINFKTSYNPEGTEEEDFVFDPSDSLIAYRTSLKTTVQEETAAGTLDKDEYLNFKQKFIRNLVAQGNVNNYAGAIVKDSADFPHEEKTQKYFKNNPFGEVLVVTDASGNILKFDNNYQISEQGRPVVFSFDRNNWNKLKMDRAAVAQKRTGVSSDYWLEQYDKESKELENAREVVNKGGKMPVELSFFVPGSLRVGHTPNVFSKIISGVNYHFEIPNDLHNSKFMVRDNHNLLNGALYAVTEPINKEGVLEPSSYIRVVPDKIINTSLYNEIKDLFFHQYSEQQHAEDAAGYIAKILYLNTGTRPRIALNKISPTEFKLGLISDKVKLSDDHFMNILDNSRYNVISKDVDTNKHTQLFIQDGKLSSRIVDYKKLIENNSSTRILPVVEGVGTKSFRYINSYIAFKFKAFEGEVKQNKQDLAPTTFDPSDAELASFNSNKTNEAENKLKEESKLNETPLKRKKIIKEDSNVEDNKKDDSHLPLFSLKNSKLDNTRTLEANSKEAKFISERFGSDRLRSINEIANSIAWGKWTKAGIYLFEGAPEGTGYHEAWHEFSQLYLMKHEKIKLYQELKNRNIEFKDINGKTLNSKTASFFQLEEYLADDFRKYALSDGKSQIAGRNQRNTIFRKIWEFIKDIVLGRVNIDKLYNDLYKNDLYKYSPSYDNAIWGRLNAGIVNKDGVELFSPAKASEWNARIDSLMSDALLSRNLFPENLVNDTMAAAKAYAAIKDIIYDNYYEPIVDKFNNDEFDDEQLIDEFDKMYLNWDSMVDYNKTHNNLGYYIEEKLPFLEDSETPQEDLDEYIQEANGEGEGGVNKEDVEFGSDKSPFGGVGNEVSSMEGASKITRALIRMLPEVVVKDNGFFRKVDVLGFPKLNEYSKTWNNIASELSNSNSYEVMYEKLQNPEFQLRVPEVTELLTRIPKPNENHTKFEMNQILAFYQDFNRAYIGVYSASFNKNSFYFQEETKRNTSSIQNTWTNNFLSIGNDNYLVKSNKIIYDEDELKYKLNPNSVLNYNLYHKTEVNEFLDLLGISFSETTYKNSRLNQVLPELLDQIQKNINARHEEGDVIFNPIIDLKRTFNKIKGVSGILNALTKIEAKYNSDFVSLSYMNAEGNMRYALSLNHYLSLIAQQMNDIQDYNQYKDIPEMKHLDKENNPYVANSIFLKNLYNEDGTRTYYKSFNGELIQNKIIVGDYDGFKVNNGEKTIKQSTTKLNNRKKIIMDMNSLLTSGSVEIMRTQASQSAYFIKLDRYDNGSNLPVPISSFSSSFRNVNFINIMNGYLKDELNRIKDFKGDTTDKIKASAKQFHLFRDILQKDPKLPSEIRASLEKSSVDFTINKFSDRIDKAIDAFFTKELERFSERLRKLNITNNDISNSLSDIKQSQLSRAFLANKFILNVEYTKLFNGDTMYQSDYKDYFKRSSLDISTGTVPMTESSFVNYMKKHEHNTIAGFIGSNVINDYKTTRSAVVSDLELQSAYLNIFKNNLKETNPDLTDKEIDYILNKYKGITVGDGQGHITLDFYRQFLKSVNNWSDSQEIGYQAELAWFRLNYSHLNSSYSEENRKMDEDTVDRYHPSVNPKGYYINGNLIQHATYPPMKIQYSGPINIPGTLAHVADKFSVAPLIPSVIKGTHFEQIAIDMVKHGIGYSKFASGTKKYKANSIDMYKENSVGIDYSKYQAPVHYLKYLKEQIKTKQASKSESIFGSQIRKLIFSNLFDNGKASEKWTNLHSEYKSIIKELSNIEKKKLFKELGLKIDGDKLVISDVKGFINKLQNVISKRDFNTNVKEYIRYDEKNNAFLYPLESSLNRGPIQDMIMGIIHRRVVRQKINGDQLIQISSAGFENTNFKYNNPNEEDIKKYGTTGLRFYHVKDGKVQPMRVKVALNNGFENLLNLKHPDGKVIETIDRLNELLSNDDWRANNEDKIRLIGYRIPTQGINSMEFMTVHQFLPATMGGTIILPAEIVTKSGSDFDIDKLSVFRPSLDERGNLIKTSQTLTNDDKFNEYAAENNKKKLSNDIINLFYKILSDTENFKDLITPNSVDVIKPIVYELTADLGKMSKKDVTKFKKEIAEGKDPKREPYTGTMIYSYMTENRKFETLLSAKKLLGIFASNNSFSQLLQQEGVKINTKYGIKKYMKMPLLLLTPAERKKVVKDGKLLIGNKYDVKGNLKQNYFSQLINGTVDAGGDDFLGYVNLNYENTGVLSYLINQGVPFDRALYFINQPALLEYYSRIDRFSGSMNKTSIKAALLEELGADVPFEKLESGETVVRSKKLLELSYNETNRIHESLSYNLKSLKNHIVENADILEKKHSSLIALHYFFILQNEVNMFRNFQNVNKFDTTKFATPIDAAGSFFKSNGATSYANTDRFIDQQYFDKLAKDSIISPLNTKRIAYLAMASLMPTGYNANFLMRTSQKLDTVYGRGDKQKIAKIISNDWIEYVVKTLGVHEGKGLYNVFNSMTQGESSMAKRLISLKKEFPELADKYRLFNKLNVLFSTDKQNKIENIKLNRVFENSVDDQNSFIDEFKQLISFYNPKYSSEEQLKIRKFFKDLAIFGFVQSGFNKSNISFTELIPNEELQDAFKLAISKFNYLTEGNPKFAEKYVDEFIYQLTQNNRQFFTNGFSQGWKGKNYHITAEIRRLAVAEINKKTAIQAELLKKQLNKDKDEVKNDPKVDKFSEDISKKLNENGNLNQSCS